LPRVEAPIEIENCLNTEENPRPSVAHDKGNEMNAFRLSGLRILEAALLIFAVHKN